MNQDRRSQARRRRIQTISQTIEELSAQLNQLIIEENQDNRVPAASPVAAAINRQASDDFQINDRVEITNNYQGLRGATGKVTCVTAKQVSVRIDGQKRVYQKSKHSVRKL
jgi:hypothetical protein